MAIEILHVVGARPNFMKVAPVMRALEAPEFHQALVHTGQHYDANLSDIFFRELEIPEPNTNLNVGSGSHADQTAHVMSALEPVLLERRPDIVVLYGDVNSTLAAALTCAKLLIPIAHVEAGLRSNDRSMPEEINRLVTDQLADILFTPSEDANQNLGKEGISADRIHFVGNVMIDTLVRLLPRTREVRTFSHSKQFALVTLHRPSNVDDPKQLREILNLLLSVSKDLQIIFPVHPRTRRRIAELGINLGQLCLCNPMPYLEFLALQERATVVITDSGGIQEETTFLGVPCLTLRSSTERPITVEVGTNILVGTDMAELRTELHKILNGSGKKGTIPELWDGRAAKRIAGILAESHSRQRAAVHQ